MGIIFGRQQIGKPIPANVAFYIRMYSIIAAVLVIAVKSAPFIATGSVLQQSIEWFFVTTTGVGNALLPLFGVDTTQKTVPIEKVASIETSEK